MKPIELWDECLMDPSTTVGKLDQAGLDALIAKVNTAINYVTP